MHPLQNFMRRPWFERRADVTSGRRRKTAGEGANRAYSQVMWPRHMTCRTNWGMNWGQKVHLCENVR